MIRGTPTRANRYHLKPTRHNTNRPSRRRTPALPSVVAVMMNAERVGPARMPPATNNLAADDGTLNAGGSTLAPSSPSTHGAHTIHEKA